MPARRFALLIAAVGLPGCLMPVAATTVEKPAGDRFRELAPGQRVARAEAAPLVASLPANPVEPPPGMVRPPDAPPAAKPAEVQVSAVEPLFAAKPPFRGPAAADEPPLLAAVRCHLDGKSDTPDPTAKLPRANRALVGMLMPLTADVWAADLSNPLQAERLAKRMAVASEAMNEVAPLVIRRAVFVDAVRKYADYDPLRADHPFLPGGLARLYVELDHQPCLPTQLADGSPGFRTQLTGTLQLRDAAGRVLEQFDAKQNKPVPAVPFEWTEFARGPVRDFHGTLEFTLPREDGRYAATIEVRDPATGRAVRTSVPFTVGR